MTSQRRKDIIGVGKVRTSTFVVGSLLCVCLIYLFTYLFMFCSVLCVFHLRSFLLLFVPCMCLRIVCIIRTF